MSTKQAIAEVVEAVIVNNAKRATKYFAANDVVTATRKLYKGRIDKRDKSIVIVLKIGRPNYAEREFIKQCKKVKEPFPIKRVQLKYPKSK